MHALHIRLRLRAPLGGDILRGRDVEDLAGFLEGEAGGGEGVGCAGGGGVGGGEFLRGAGLFVGFGEGAAEDAGAS